MSPKNPRMRKMTSMALNRAKTKENHKESIFRIESNYYSIFRTARSPISFLIFLSFVYEFKNGDEHR